MTTPIRFFSAMVLILVFSTYAFSQTIHRDDFPFFHGSVTAVLNTHGGKLVSEEFDEWAIGFTQKPPSHMRIDYRSHDRQWFWAKASRRTLGIEVPNRNLVVVPLQAFYCAERQNLLLSFWKTKGDSLEFAFFDPMVRKASMTGLRVEEGLDTGDTGLIVLTEIHWKDAGYCGGTYQFSRCQPDSQTVQKLYSESYSMSWKDAHTDTLRVELVAENNEVNARMIRTKITWGKQLNSKGQYELLRYVTGIDTSHVILID